MSDPVTPPLQPWWPEIRGVSDAPRWLRFLYCLSRPVVERSHAGRVVLWTIDTILREPWGVAALDAILAQCDASALNAGAIVALVRGTYATRAHLPSRPVFAHAAYRRVRVLGRADLIRSNEEFATMDEGERSFSAAVAGAWDSALDAIAMQRLLGYRPHRP